MPQTDGVSTMREEYDLSNAEPGKLYRKDAQLDFPVYLESEVLRYFMEKARTKGVDLDQLVNDTLKKDISLVESIK